MSCSVVSKGCSDLKERIGFWVCHFRHNRWVNKVCNRVIKTDFRLLRIERKSIKGNEGSVKGLVRLGNFKH